ncbi:uncharacterized protein EAF01_008605 [Botrytis porri]|uniref:uncharacterized protein n=1 Tax=Botrytis porri TaxID=87229 RepID=UPI0019019C02|nr:uncharacterized protein EAF01_008605 [Botrytis porri]KAF7899392.1 hypothetical protein EAF01_008605 [Botrytis porri]
MSQKRNQELPPTKAPLPPFGQPGHQGKSALLRENFLCNLADAIVPTGLFGDHKRHRRDSAYRAGDFKKADVEAHDEEDDWVNLTDKTVKSGPLQITPRDTKSEEHRRSPSMSKSPPMNQGFSQAKLNLTPAVVGQPDNSKFILRRYDIRSPTKIEKKRIDLHIDEFDWSNKEHVDRLNKARRHWEINTLESNPQTSGKSRVTIDGRRSPVDTSVGSWSPGDEEGDGDSIDF